MKTKCSLTFFLVIFLNSYYALSRSQQKHLRTFVAGLVVHSSIVSAKETGYGAVTSLSCRRRRLPSTLAIVPITEYLNLQFVLRLARWQLVKQIKKRKLKAVLNYFSLFVRHLITYYYNVLIFSWLVFLNST